MEQATEMMLYECNYALKWGIALVVIGVILFIVGLLITKTLQEGVFLFITGVIVLPLLIIGVALIIGARYDIRKINMYPEASYYQYYNRDIDVHIKGE